MAAHTPPETTGARVDALPTADAVVCVPACGTAEAVRRAADRVARAVARLSPPSTVVLLHPDTAVAADTGGAGTDRVAAVPLLPHRLSPMTRLPLAAADGVPPVHALAAVASHAGARACCLVAARADDLTADAVHALLRPVVELNFDLVLPIYARHRLDGLINSSIVHPLTRALYGRRADGQLGLDFAFSARFVPALLEPTRQHGRPRAVWPVTEAVERGLQICQAHLGTWVAPVEESADAGSALSQVLGSLFLDVEHHAPVWQKVRGSQDVPAFGSAAPFDEEARDVDVGPMIESFQLGFRNLPDVWSRALPPATLVELGRLARAPRAEFRVPDALWARIVYDFALGHRLRVINRDHLLRAFAPIYLAWVASFVLDAGGISRAAVGARLERLCQAYEAEKPYLMSRWRWPDRFNP